MMLDMFRLI